MTRVFSATNATCGSMQFVWALARRRTGHFWRNRQHRVAMPSLPAYNSSNGISDSPFESSIEELTQTPLQERAAKLHH